MQKTMLSKWWRTQSAKEAQRRVEAQRKQKAKKVRAYFADKKAKLKEQLAKEEQAYQRELLDRS